MSEDMKTLASKDNIQMKLRKLLNFLAWMAHIEKLMQKLPESASDLKMLSFIEN